MSDEVNEDTHRIKLVLQTLIEEVDRGGIFHNGVSKELCKTQLQNLL